MVKPKQRHIRCAPGKQQQNQCSPETDPPDEGDWTVVKKQRINILIPPLPIKAPSILPNVGEGQLQEKPRNMNSQSQSPSGRSVSKQSVHETEKFMSSSPEQAVHHPKILHPSEPNLTFQKLSNMPRRIASHDSPLDSFRDGKGIGTCRTSDGSKRMMIFADSFRDGKGIGTCRTSDGSKRMMIFADSSAFLNQRMRASYLERKLQKAGGLENWLVSLGLTRFVKVFERRRVNRFQLANLTMKKLKEMGADAVGPRRKLMHAIDCLCEPHCFQHV